MRRGTHFCCCWFGARTWTDSMNRIMSFENGFRFLAYLQSTTTTTTRIRIYVPHIHLINSIHPGVFVVVYFHSEPTELFQHFDGCTSNNSILNDFTAFQTAQCTEHIGWFDSFSPQLILEIVWNLAKDALSIEQHRWMTIGKWNEK